MIKINLQTFNLVCQRNTDGRKFIYKYKTKEECRLIDCETGEVLDLTSHHFRKNYTPCKGTNSKTKKRPHFMNYGKKRLA